MATKWLSGLSLALLASLLIAGHALAAPPLPFDVFGTVLINSANALPGTLVQHPECSDPISQLPPRRQSLVKLGIWALTAPAL